MGMCCPPMWTYRPGALVKATTPVGEIVTTQDEAPAWSWLGATPDVVLRARERDQAA